MAFQSLDEFVKQRRANQPNNQNQQAPTRSSVPTLDEFVQARREKQAQEPKAPGALTFQGDYANRQQRRIDNYNAKVALHNDLVSETNARQQKRDAYFQPRIAEQEAQWQAYKDAAFEDMNKMLTDPRYTVGNVQPNPSGPYANYDEMMAAAEKDAFGADHFDSFGKTLSRLYSQDPEGTQAAYDKWQAEEQQRNAEQWQSYRAEAEDSFNAWMESGSDDAKAALQSAIDSMAGLDPQETQEFIDGLNDAINKRAAAYDFAERIGGTSDAIVGGLTGAFQKTGMQTGQQRAENREHRMLELDGEIENLRDFELADAQNEVGILERSVAYQEENYPWLREYYDVQYNEDNVVQADTFHNISDYEQRLIDDYVATRRNLDDARETRDKLQAQLDGWQKEYDGLQAEIDAEQKQQEQREQISTTYQEAHAAGLSMDEWYTQQQAELDRLKEEREALQRKARADQAQAREGSGAGEFAYMFEAEAAAGAAAYAEDQKQIAELQSQIETQESLLQLMSSYRWVDLASNPDFEEKAAAGLADAETIRNIAKADAVLYPDNIAIGAANADKTLELPTSQWTEEQKKIWGYLHERDKERGTDEAREYGITINNQLQAEEIANTVANASGWEKAGISVATIAMQPFRTVMSGMALIDDAANLISGEKINPYSVWRQPSIATQQYRSEIASGMSDTGSWFYNTGMSAGDSAMNMLLGSALGSAFAGGLSATEMMHLTNAIGSGLMSSEVASLAVKEGIEKGYSDAGAFALGLIRGGVEYASEALGGEWVIKNIKADPMRFLRNTMINMVPEGVEEVMSDAMNGAINLGVDALFGTEESGIPQLVQHFKEEGTPWQKEHPELAAVLAIGGDELVSFLSGSVASLGSTGIQTAQMQAGISETATRLDTNNNAVVQLMNELNVEDPSAIYWLADLYDAENLQDLRTKMGDTKQASALAEEIMKSVSDAKPDSRTEAARQAFARMVGPTATETATPASTAMPTAPTVPETLSPAERMRAASEITATETEAPATPKSAEEREAAFVKGEIGYEEMMGKSAEEVAQNRREVMDGVLERVAKRVDVNISVSDRKALAGLYTAESNGTRGETYAKAAIEAYEMGRTADNPNAATARENSKFGTRLSAAQFTRAYNLGAESGDALVVDASTEQGKTTLEANLAFLGANTEKAAGLYEEGQDVKKYAAGMRLATGFAANGGDVATMVQQAKSGEIENNALASLSDAQVKAAQEIGQQMQEERTQKVQKLKQQRVAISQQAESILEQENPELRDVNESLRSVNDFIKQAQTELDTLRAGMEAMRQADENAESTDEYKQAKKQAETLERSIEDAKKVRDEMREKRKEIRGKVERKKGTVTYAKESGEVGGLKYNAVDKASLSATQKAAARITEIIAKMTGLDIRIADFGNGVGGEYIPGAGGVLWLNINAKFNGANITIASLSHELTHWLQEYAPEEYNELKQVVAEEINKNPAAFADIFNERSATQANLNADQITDEMVANACQKMLADEDSVKRILQEHQKLGEKMRAFLLRMIDRLKAAFSELDNAKNFPLFKEVKAAENAMDRMRDIWFKGFETASENLQAEYTVSRANGVKENAAGEGDVQYMAGKIEIGKGPSAIKGDKRTAAAILAEHLADLKDMDSVATLNGDEMNDRTKDLPTQISEFFESVGGQAYRKGMGPVILGEYGVGGIMNHQPINRAKMVTLVSVPEVIENGKVINYDPDWKGRGYASITIAAPVEVAGHTVYVAAVVDQRDGYKFYLNECVDSDGNYVRIREDLSDNTKSGVTAQDGLTRGSERSSGDSITEPAEEVKAKKQAWDNAIEAGPTDFEIDEASETANIQFSRWTWEQSDYVKERANAAIELSERFNEDSNDIRYQRWDDTSDDTTAERAGREMAVARLQSENAILAETLAQVQKLSQKQGKTIEALQKKLQLTKTPETRMYDARKLAKSLIQQHNSTANVDELATQIKALGDYLLQTETDKIDEAQLKGMARSIARDILETATDTFGAEDDTFKDVAERIRGRKLSIDESFLGELDDYDRFRKSLFGRLTLAKREANSLENREGYSTVDQFYVDMQNEFGKGLFPDVANEGEQVQILASLLDASQPINVNPYEAYMGEVTEELANRIVMDAMNGVLRPTAPTTADKQKARTKALQERIQELKKDAKLADREAASLYHTIYDLSVALDKAESKYNTLRTEADYRAAQVRAEGRAREAEIKATERERAAKQVKALKDYYTDMRERANERRKENAGVTKYRKQVEQKAKKLSEMLLTNSDKLHVPEVLKAPLGEFLESIDLTSKRALAGGEETRADQKFGARLMRLQQMLENQQRYIDGDSSVKEDLGGYIDVSPEILDYLRNMAEMITMAMNTGRTFTINQMNAEDLKVLSQFLSNLRAAINNMNNFMANERYNSVREAANQDIEDMKKLGRARASANSSVNEFMAWQNGTPYYVFKRLGNGARSIFDGFARGWEKMAMNAQEIIEFSKKTFTAKEAKEWKNEIHDIELEDGSKIRMTTAQIMAFSRSLERAQALKHIEKGGVRIGDIQQKSGKINDVTHYHLSEKDIKNIVGLLTDRQLEVAKALQKYMAEKGSEWGNEISMRRFGYNFYTEGDTYFPIATDSNDRPMADTDAQNNSMFRLLNLSASKALNPKASNALVINDIFDVFADHMSDMAKMNGMGLPILDAIKWFNYKERINRDDGTYDTRTLQGAMQQAFGDYAGRYFRTLMKDINGQSESGDRGMNLFGKLISNAKAAAVGANLRVALLQPTSYLRAMTVLKPQYLIGAFAHKNAYKEAMKYSGTAVWKSLGFFETDINRSMREQIQQSGGIRDELIEKSMAGAELGDRLTWGRLWVACKMQTKAQNKSLEGEALNNATADLFREVIYSSQVMDSTLTRSEIMRSKGTFTKLSSAFMAEPTLSYNILMDAASEFNKDVRENGRQGAWKRNAGKIGRAFTVYVSSAAFSAFMESLADAVRDDDEDDFWEKFMDAFWGEDGKWWTGNFAQDLTILGKLPGIKNYVSKLQGYKSNDLSITAFSNALDAYAIWKETIDLETGELDKATKTTYYGNMTTWGKVYKTMQALSQFSGLPGANMARDATAIWNNIIGASKPSWKIKTYRSKNEQKWLDTLEPLGVSWKDYQNALTGMNADGNSSISQAEAGPYLATEVQEGRLTQEQAEAMWRATTSGKASFSEWFEKNGDSVTGEEATKGGVAKSTYDDIMQSANEHGDGMGGVTQDELGAELNARIESGEVTQEEAAEIWSTKGWSESHDLTWWQENNGMPTAPSAPSAALLEAKPASAATQSAEAEPAPVEELDELETFKRTVPVYSDDVEAAYTMWQNEVQPLGVDLDQYSGYLVRADAEGDKNESVKQDELGMVLLDAMNAGEIDMEQASAIWRTLWHKGRSHTFEWWLNK